MSTYRLSQYGQTLLKFIEDSPIPDLFALFVESKETDFPIEEYSDLWAAAHNTPSPCDLDLVRGPADALALSIEDRKWLAYSYVFDPTIGPRPNS